MTRAWLLAAGLLAVACGGGDSPSISERDASDGECANGGTVLLVNNAPAATVCNGGDGTNGKDGKDGKDGATGAQGLPGTPGAKGISGTDGAPGATGARGPAGVDTAGPSTVVAAIAAHAASMVIVACTDGTNTAYGSGTKTNTGTVITALHVLTNATGCDVYSETPVTLLGSETASSQHGDRDEVELTVNWNADGAAIAGLTPQLGLLPNVGDLVTVVGNPGAYDGLTLEHQYTTGSVTSTSLAGTLAEVPAFANQPTLWSQAWATDAVSWHGDSGGPVFDANGDWIGILVGGFNGATDNEGPNLSIVLPLL